MFPKSSGPHSGAKWFVIVNPVAGGGRGLDHFPQISKHLRDAHIRCEPVFTEHKFHATELTVTAVREDTATSSSSEATARCTRW